MKLPALPRASIGVQLVALVLGCLAALHLVLFVIVGLFPPPRPPIYRMSEIATALNGGPLTARDGRPMLRSIETTLPREVISRTYRYTSGPITNGTHAVSPITCGCRAWTPSARRNPSNNSSAIAPSNAPRYAFARRLRPRRRSTMASTML